MICFLQPSQQLVRIQLPGQPARQLLMSTEQINQLQELRAQGAKVDIQIQVCHCAAALLCFVSENTLLILFDFLFSVQVNSSANLETRSKPRTVRPATQADAQRCGALVSCCRHCAVGHGARAHAEWRTRLRAFALLAQSKARRSKPAATTTASRSTTA